jgi:4-hydroxyphenylacetate 3-monooxygenase
MAARTGQEYIDRLASMRPTVHIQGETVSEGIPNHPAFKNLVASYAALYDMQHDPELAALLTYESPSSGERVGRSFAVPHDIDELARRREMMKVWADYSLGSLGRTGDYLNCCLMALSEAGPWFAQADPAFAANVAAYYERIREEDLLLTHTLITPQANRSQDAAKQLGGALTARIVREDDNGVVISGARMLATIGPIADELLVFPSTVLRGTPEDAPYSFALAINCDAPGLRFICRESLDYGRSHFDHPLGSRFEEIDAVVVFDEVHVPFERCFMLGHPELCNTIYTETSAVAHMTHQVATRTIAKTEAFLGLV